MTAYSGLWNGVHSENYALQTDRTPLRRQLARVLRRRSHTVMREVLDTVAAAASINGAAAVTYARVTGDPDPGNPASGGGAVTVGTVTKIAAASTTSAAQVADVDAVVDWRSFPNTAGAQNYPTDASGNGGGAALDKAYAPG